MIGRMLGLLEYDRLTMRRGILTAHRQQIPPLFFSFPEYHRQRQQQNLFHLAFEEARGRKMSRSFADNVGSFNSLSVLNVSSVLNQIIVADDRSEILTWV